MKAGNAIRRAAGFQIYFGNFLKAHTSKLFLSSDLPPDSNYHEGPGRCEDCLDGYRIQNTPYISKEEKLQETP